MLFQGPNYLIAIIVVSTVPAMNFSIFIDGKL
jgi:hypothetical protein